MKQLLPKSHFQKRMKYRFNLPRNEVDQLECRLMSNLFMGQLKIVEEDNRGLKIYYPTLHENCILVFNKEKNRFRTGYKANKCKQLKLLNRRIL